MCEVVSKTLLLKKNIVLPKNPLFSRKTHCFPTCALFYPIVLKRKIITATIHVLNFLSKRVIGAATRS